MQVIVSENCGFCMGVKNAVDTAMKISGQDVCILGEIIHNPSVISKIKSLGTKIVEKKEDVDSKKVIIRSHGEPKSTFDYFESKGIEVINCTCPFVIKTQKLVAKYYELGYKIVILGDKAHPEVIGINGWCENSAYITDREEYDLELENYDKICVVSQTTFSKEKFLKFLENLKNYRLKTVEIFETICYTTNKRQDEAVKLSESCDAIVIIGGANSSNTRKLYDICKERCENTFMVEEPKYLDYNNLKRYESVGVISGASTPREQAMEVFLTMAEEVKVNSENSSELTMEEALNKFEANSALKLGQKIKVIVMQANDDGLLVYFNGKTESTLAKEELLAEVYNKEDYKLGEEIEVIVIGKKPLKVSQKQIEILKQEEAMAEELKSGKIVNVTITGKNSGGLLGKLLNFNVFIPAGEIKIGYVKDLDKYIGKTLRVKPLKVEYTGRKKEIVGSQKVILEAEKAERDAARAKKEEEFFASISENDVVTGTVVRFAAFGAFVDVNGFDCLAHVSDLSWAAHVNPSDVLEIGKSYDFVVKKCDKESKKVSLGYKQLQPKPWDIVLSKYVVGDVITGKVVRLVSFGAFVEVANGVDGLVHVSQISHEYLENPATALKVGDEVTAKILAIDSEKEKMTLSIKALLPAPEVEKKEKEEKPKKEKKVKTEEDDEVREWNEGSTEVSLADLLKK